MIDILQGVILFFLAATSSSGTCSACARGAAAERATISRTYGGQTTAP